ncbi:hypothetical protein A3Q56_00141 [Intoshia linei]|uniref:BTBD10/KCTD20 BTB/POZ domain-containing protein n=1 Tax=Intoshia linei TaxID=1819745 RepID=A0A177BCS1_9BILA|nr:hypothetical protein A3Q56_00141 [Intoshia linei]
MDIDFDEYSRSDENLTTRKNQLSEEDIINETIESHQSNIKCTMEFPSDTGLLLAVHGPAQNFYETGKFTCPPDVPTFHMRKICDYFLIPFNPETVVQDSFNLRDLLHEFADNGAKNKFNVFVQNDIYPVLITATNITILPRSNVAIIRN